MAASLLDKAEVLARKGRHGEVVSLLEPQLPIYRESSRYYRLLGSACLRTGDSGGAYTYLKRAEQLDPHDADVLLCLGGLHLRRAETQKAVDYYLRVLEERPQDRQAARALGFLRKAGFEEALPGLMEAGALEKFLPSPGRLPRLFLGLGLGTAILAGLVLLGFIGLKGLKAIEASRAPRPEIAAIVLSAGERQAPVETGGSYRFVLTEKEALASFEKAKELFQVYRDNAALVILNRLILANVSPSMKEKAKTLKAFVTPPDFRNLKDIPSYSEVMRDPELYEGCAVLWQGSAANIQAGPSGLDFHFLVGYVDGKRLEGILPVQLSGPANLVPTQGAFELLAKVRTLPSLALEGVAIHSLRNPGP